MQGVLGRQKVGRKSRGKRERVSEETNVAKAEDCKAKAGSV